MSILISESIQLFTRNKNSRSSSRYGPPLRTEYRLIVENLSSRVSWQVSEHGSMYRALGVVYTVA